MKTCKWCHGKGSIGVEPGSSTRYKCPDCNGRGALHGAEDIDDDVSAEDRLTIEEVDSLARYWEERDRKSNPYTRPSQAELDQIAGFTPYPRVNIDEAEDFPA